MAYKYKTLFLTEKDSQVEALAPVLGAAYKAKWQPAYNEKEKTLKILELKKPDNKETMLRCVLEAPILI